VVLRGEGVGGVKGRLLSGDDGYSSPAIGLIIKDVKLIG
jgi:hypothetical protein